MKRAFCSAAAFAKNERAVFIIIIICVVASAFIINFSYGLYYNFVTQKNETELELKNLNPELSQGEVITKGEFQRFAESLDEKTLNSMIVIYAGAELAEFESEAGPGSFPMRFVIHAGRYNICEVTRKNWAQTRAALAAMALPEADWFIENCLGAFEKNLDELGTMEP